jgi:hypothetical protein
VNRRGIWILVASAVALGAMLIPLQRVRSEQKPVPAQTIEIRRLLLDEIQPVKLSNCELQRFGEANDGGYLLCGNLLTGVRSAYSYGISGYDGWGCDVSRGLRVPVHQYDCFNLTRPLCEGGQTIFHPECIGPSTVVEEGRPFDTLKNQIARNGDAEKHLVIKMDVEGAEWNSFLSTPDDVLQKIDQLVVEFHGSDRGHYIEALRKLKRFFHVAHLHWNNYSCSAAEHPFKAWAYEVLLVNRKIGVADPSGKIVLPHALDAPNAPGKPDCQ